MPEPPTSDLRFESGNSVSFESFWKKAAKKAFPKPTTFIRHDGEATSATLRQKKSKKTDQARPSIGGDGISSNANSDTAEPTPRRKQIAQAQRLHRQRKAEYMQSLEREISVLRELDAAASKETSTTGIENTAIRHILSAHGVTAPPQGLVSITDHGPASITVAYDAAVDAERVFVEKPPQMRVGAHSELINGTYNKVDPNVDTADTKSNDNAYIALDFILALEHGCRTHIYHPSVASQARTPKEPGHALTTTMKVYSRATRVSVASDRAQSLNTSTSDGWYISYLDIEKLFHLSEALQLEDEITPAQAYHHLKCHRNFAALPQVVIQKLKEELGRGVKCYGFGAVLEVSQFWQIVDSVFGTNYDGYQDRLACR